MTDVVHEIVDGEGCRFSKESLIYTLIYIVTPSPLLMKQCVVPQ